MDRKRRQRSLGPPAEASKAVLHDSARAPKGATDFHGGLLARRNNACFPFRFAVPRHRKAAVAEARKLHALGHLLVTTPALFGMFSTRDARHLRLADTALRVIVSEHPWADLKTPVRRTFAGWRASFPAATGVFLAYPLFTAPRLSKIAGLTSLRATDVGMTEQRKDMPLAAVRCMPVLTSLHFSLRDDRHYGGVGIPATSPVWHELGRLRELSIGGATPAALMPSSAFSLLGGLRKLDLSNTSHKNSVLVTDSILALLPLLEDLSLRGSELRGPGFATLTRLTTLSLASNPLPSDFFDYVAPTLRSLELSNCKGQSEIAMDSAALRNVRMLRLAGNTTSVSVFGRSLANMKSLEALEIRGFFRNSFSQAFVAILGCLPLLNCLLVRSSYNEPAMAGLDFEPLSHCVLREADLSVVNGMSTAQLASLPKSLRKLKAYVSFAHTPLSFLRHIVVRAGRVNLSCVV